MEHPHRAKTWGSGPLLVGGLAGSLIAGAPTVALADVAPAPGTDSVSLCDPAQDEGDDCTTDDGESGTCSADREQCFLPPYEEYQQCPVCDVDCSVPHVGAGVPRAGLGWGVVLGLAWLWRRCRRTRR